MSDCRFGVSPVNYPNPDPRDLVMKICKHFSLPADSSRIVPVVSHWRKYW